MITIKSFDGGEFGAYVALPASGYGPGLVVLQEIFGVNEYLRKVCDWYAAHGFVAICPDLFWRQERGIQLTDQTEAEWQKAFALYQGLDEAKAVEDSAAAVAFLRKYPACSGRVGAVGFCLGGNLAWRSCGQHYDASAAELANLRTLEFFVRNLAGEGLAAAQKSLSDRWEEHVKYEFATRDTEDTLRTMVPDAYVNHVPVMTGGVGHDQLREFYSRRFIPQMPPDTSMTPVSRTVGIDRVVDEMVFEFTHTIKMDWMLPGVEPTGKHVKVPLIVVVHFRDGKLAHEHIYWDQASVLVQLGLIDSANLPVAGVETAAKVLDPNLPANELMKRQSAR